MLSVLCALFSDRWVQGGILELDLEQFLNRQYERWLGLHQHHVCRLTILWRRNTMRHCSIDLVSWFRMWLLLNTPSEQTICRYVYYLQRKLQEEMAQLFSWNYFREMGNVWPIWIKHSMRCVLLSFFWITVLCNRSTFKYVYGKKFVGHNLTFDPCKNEFMEASTSTFRCNCTSEGAVRDWSCVFNIYFIVF